MATCSGEISISTSGGNTKHGDATAATHTVTRHNYVMHKCEAKFSFFEAVPNEDEDLLLKYGEPYFKSKSPHSVNHNMSTKAPQNGTYRP